MRVVSLLVLTVLNLKAQDVQDTLFWFDMNTVLDPMPKTPKILDDVFGTSQLKVYDSLYNAKTISEVGFRLQIFETTSVDEAYAFLGKFKDALVDTIYMDFQAPLYKLRYGNFVTRKEAEIQKRTLIRMDFENVWIVRSRIDQYPSSSANIKKSD